MKKVIAIILFIVSFSKAYSQENVANLIKDYRLIEAKKIIDQKLSNPSLATKDQAEFWKLLGEISIKLGNYSESLEHYDKSKKLWLSIGNKAEYAKTLGDMGIVEWKLGNIESAYDNLSRSANTLKKLGLAHLLANTQNNLGLILSETKPEKALGYYNQALSTYRKNNNQENYLITNNNIGIIHRTQGRYDTALDLFLKTLNDTKDNNFQKAFTKANIAQTYLLLNNKEKALTYFKNALITYEKVFGTTHPEIASIHSQMAEVYSKQNDFKSAENEAQQACLANSKDKKAKIYYDRKLQISILHQNAEILLHKFHDKSLAPKDVKEALSLLVSADKLIQEQRNFLFNKKDKITFNAKAREIYECEMECLSILNNEPFAKKRGYLNMAFELIEKSKASTLLSSIQDSKAKKFGKIPEDILLEEREITAYIASMENDLLNPSLSDAREQELRASLLQKRESYKKLTQRLEKEYPKYFELKYSSKLITPSKIQEKLKEGEMLVNYFLSERDRKITAFKITKSKAWMESRNITPKFEKWMILMRNSMKFTVPGGFKSAASQLSHQLLLNKKLKTINKLIIIPDGVLNSIPFEALISKPTKEQKEFKDFSFLVLSHEFNYHFSASLWSSEQRKAKEKPSFQVLAPVYFEESHNFPDLPATEKEAFHLDSLFKVFGHNSSSYLEKKATEKTLLNLPTSDILHIPTHGEVFSSSPDKSRILLSKTNDTYDGFLYMGEIYNSSFNYDLVTLSACQTGLGKQSKGEGVIGLSRAFIYAGAQNIMVSYWKVDDVSTAQLMIDFYTSHLNSGCDSYSKSLQESKKKMISGEKYANPYYWAPFILIGR